MLGSSCSYRSRPAAMWLHAASAKVASCEPQVWHARSGHLTMAAAATQNGQASETALRKQQARRVPAVLAGRQCGSG